jgi:type I restriction enzyme M protein
MTNLSNRYCKLRNLRNESDVEQNFVLRLLDDLGFTEDYRESKTTITPIQIDKGRKRRSYAPDFICYLDSAHKQPALIVDAKAPDEEAVEGVEDAQLYASVIRRSLPEPKLHQICMGSNAHVTIVKSFDSDAELARLTFVEFERDSKKFEKLMSLVSRPALKAASEKKQAGAAPWEPAVPSVEDIKAAFQKSHNRIWKRESLLPTAAFYEFTKLIFLKLREDERLHRLMDKGKKVLMKDLYFHTDWIDANSEVSPNPVNSILFQRLNDDLAEGVRKNKKKPIFDAGEQIRLKPSTIRAVVEILQDYDLSKIDEDLNGRMFEVFLSAAVRGKNLGAFFTPRAIVELMVKIVAPAISRKGGNTYIETILDGCCGSGGFLIDVMADMLREIRNNPALSPNAKTLEERLLTEHIYGIESNPDIARIARINMFLHGDGGSRIYRADALDKDFQIEEGESHYSRDEISELKQFIKRGLQFDAVLTNPPFATAYTSKDEHEKRILSQYALHEGSGGVTRPPESAKSNVLFLARYFDLLRPGGRMAIVLDNSMLNSHSFAPYRSWLRDHYIIRAVIGLPKYAFIQAGAGGVTSILYLEKRASMDQEQPPVFARDVHYTGLSKSGKEIDENDLPAVFAEWQKFETTGKLFLEGKKLIGGSESDVLFVIDPNTLIDRIDVSYHVPSFRRAMAKIEEIGKAGTHVVKTISDFELAEKVDVETAGETIFKYIDIGAIDSERCQLIPSEIKEGTLAELSDRARILVRENDVIFPLSYDSFGKVAIVPKELDGQLASTGLLAVRCDGYDEAVLLWAIIRSDVMQRQFHHLASGYTQRGISKEHLTELKFPIPKLNRGELVQAIKDHLREADSSRCRELRALEGITIAMDTSLKGKQSKAK